MSVVIDHRPQRQPAPQPPRVKRDPAPSRLKYRLERMWLTPLYRRVLRVGLPAFLAAMTAGIWLADEDRRAALTDGIAGLVEKVQSREAFQVKMMTIEGASPAVDKALRGMLPVDLPASSFDIDLAALRLQVLRLDAVESIDLRIKPGGILSAVVTEREPVLLWRHARGIDMLDAGGHRVAGVTSREMRPNLPLIAGEGADMATEEALALIDAAGPILPRLRGLVRKGERRWDVVLDKGQQIMLPAEGAVTALEAAMALNRAQDMLGRDISVVDLRDPSRPVIRLGLDARNTIRLARDMLPLGPDGKVIEKKKGG
ncbi:cell division protein FtsQ/DivIB [Paracoccus methylarcula]|uniref:Cell division protein FtsQ n=1 Tax=Paracoccus methylarcula TaxID=72022 RepID=A0A3R7PN32_9RHOB|nr:cell division protein FtsQ/DivIB [Paracoccus methylarcula]RNF33055.1 cell division protein FtsQ [Paracoccus methylarcula]